ncbi:MAG: proprotein convertase P-domain-containing protein, partial [Phycisphaerae bacterium]
MISLRFRSGLGFCVVAVFAVQSAWGRPGALTHESQPLETVARIVVPAVDLEAVRLEDRAREAQGLAPRFAIPTPVQIRPDADGTWESIDDDTLLWRLRIGSPGAVSINLGFSRYHMPAGGRLFVYAADDSHVIRPFTHLDNETHGELWTPPVFSAEIVVELTIPAAALPALDLELSSINIGYRGFGHLLPDRSGSCNVDVVCPEGDDWQDQIKSVGVISTGGYLFCTGFAVNNTARDLTPYFMTANHCGINSGNAASLVVYWNYENSTCRPPGSPASGGPGDGSLAQFQTGSYFRASYSSSDFTLVELDDDPDPQWDVVFAGWDRSSGDSTSAVAIHHPNCDEKRISFEYDPTSTTSYLGTAIPGDGTHVRVTDWDLGTTEPGSSGSPLFNQDKRVVGQLHGGYAACGNDLSDWYGRFSVSWTGGGTSSTRLSNWLDPGSTGEIAIDHISTGGMTVTPGDDVLHIGEVGGPFTNPSVTYTLTNPTGQAIDYEVSLTASFGILLDGGTDPVTGTLAASGGVVDVVVTLGPDIDSLGNGVYVEDIVFDDVTNGSSTTRRHTVEIGQTRFLVDPETGLESSGPEGGPFPGSVVYTVTSERPTPVSVEVSASDPWISLDGGSGPITLNLSGTGDFDTVTVGFSAAAESLSPGVYSGTVSFTNLSGGAGDTTRPVFLDVGRVVYNSTDTPKPINDNSTITSTINVPDGYCVGDLDVEIDITHTYIGDLIVELQSPGGTTVRLHNHTGGGASDIVQTYDDDGIAPDGPGMLADFNLTLSTGTWTLTVSDNASGDTGTLNHWALRLGPL